MAEFSTRDGTQIFFKDWGSGQLIARMAALLEPLEAADDQRRYFRATYQRTTIAVAAELQRGGFAAADWVERWDVAFAELYLDALEADMAGTRPGTAQAGRHRVRRPAA